MAMILTDTHSHMYDVAFDEDRDDAVARATGAGVMRMFLPAIDSTSHEAMFGLWRAHKELFFPMMGLHPTSVNDNPDYMKELALVEEFLKNPPVDKLYAIGEVGLDLYWSNEWEAQQREVFERQIELSIEYDLPLVIHTRNAWNEMVEVLEQYKRNNLRGVMHAFSGTYDHYKRVKAVGDFVIGVGGVVTYKKSDIADMLPRMPLEDVVLETDAPYLTPMPFRGKRNESSYLTYICAKVAEIYGQSIDHVAEQTTANSARIFKI